MKLSQIQALMLLAGAGTNDSVTYGNLCHLADDDVSKPEHVAERAENLDALVQQKEAEAAGSKTLAAIASGTPVSDTIDYDKLAAAIVSAQSKVAPVAAAVASSTGSSVA